MSVGGGGGGAFAPTPPASGGTGNSPFTSQQPASEPTFRTADFQDSNGNGIDDRDEGPNTPQPQVDYSMGFGRRFQQPSFINPFMGGYGFNQPFGGGFQQPYGGGFGNSFGAMMSGLGSLFGGYRAMPFGGYQSMPQPPMNQGPGNAYVQPIGGTIAPGRPSPPLMDDLGPPIGVLGGGDEYWGPGGIRDQQREETRNWYESRGMNPPQQAALLPAVGSSSPYLNMQGLGGLFGGGRGIGIAPPSQAQRYDPYSFNPQADAQRQQQQMLMDREANTTDYQRLMQRKNSASAGPYVNPLTGEVGGVNPFSQVQDAEIARSLGWQDPNMITDMRAKMPHEYEAENAARNAKAREYLNSIGYGTEGFDSSKYEVRRQPIGPSPGLSGLFSGLF